jgi:hypothetical protein
MGFFARVGGVLVAPRRTFARLAAGEARTADVAWLLVAKLLAEDLPAMVRAFFVAREESVSNGLQLLLVSVRAVLLRDVLGILVAGVMMSLFVGKAQRGYGRTLDLAAYAWIPYFTLQLGAALFFTARGHEPAERVQQLVDGIGLLWATVAWTLALLAARQPKTEPGT